MTAIVQHWCQRNRTSPSVVDQGEEDLAQQVAASDDIAVLKVSQMFAALVLNE
jgi:hypothetical protein